MNKDSRLDELLVEEQKIATTLDGLIHRAENVAKELDPRTLDEMYRPLPTEHPSSRLRYAAYRLRIAREALL